MTFRTCECGPNLDLADLTPPTSTAPLHYAACRLATGTFISMGRTRPADPAGIWDGALSDLAIWLNRQWRSLWHSMVTC